MSIKAYPKIFHLGDAYINDLFKGSVIVQEKIDGSQLDFGIDLDDNFCVRSKGKELVLDNPDKLFAPGVEYLLSIQDRIYNRLKLGDIIFCEYLKSPHHNILSYGRIPNHNIIVFGAQINNRWIVNHNELIDLANAFDLETVPLLYEGEVTDTNNLVKYFELESILGKEKLEGIVIKNYNQPIMIGSAIWPSLAKMVRQEFKERHASEWGPRFSQSDKLLLLIESVRTEARWHKAFQHLRDDGKLSLSPKDIGLLIKEVQRDLFDEEKENLKNQLWQHYKDQFERKSVAGFPEWYKQYLIDHANQV